MADKNVVNPGLVNVADEADGRVSVDQAVTGFACYLALAWHFRILPGISFAY